MAPLNWPDDPGQGGLLAGNINGLKYSGITQASVAAASQAAQAAAATTIANNLNGTPMGNTPGLHLDPMGL